jgi:plastocyanin
LALPLGCGGARQPVTHTVHVDATAFSPAVLDVRVGDTVVWVNDDLLVHTVTGDSGGLASGDIAAGASWRYTAEHAGGFDYRCDYHPTMKGTLRVS